MKIKISLLFVFLPFLLVATSPSLFSEVADFILFNGKIITIDSQDQIVEAIAIKDGKILSVGSNQEILQYSGAGCKQIDLKGKTLTPGLIDSHLHLMYWGQQFWPGYLNIRHPEVTCKADLLNLIKEHVKKLKPGEWISGNQGFTLKMNETLDRWDLDLVCPDNPAYLRHSSGQFSVVNSKALEIAKINKNTPNPHSSRILRDSTGEPTGILMHYPAENLVAQFATGYGDRTQEEKWEDIIRGQKLCFEAGYTSVQDVIVSNFNDILLYKNFADSSLLKIRLYAMLYINNEEQANNAAQLYKPIKSGRFIFGGWKLAMDGGLAAKTLLMYNKNLFASSLSYPYFEQDELNRIVKILHNTGLQIAVHVSGDQGIDMTINALEEAMKENPRPDPRHRIEHGLFPSLNALKRFQQNKIILSTQPQWITWYGDGYSQTTDAATMKRLLLLKTILDMGIPIAFGCDVPASIYQEPKWAFFAAVSRKSAQSPTIFNPEERLTIQDALRIHTMGSAYASFSEQTTGSLEPGKFADLVVWSHDLYTMSPTDAILLTAELTMVNGEVVYTDGKNIITSVDNNYTKISLNNKSFHNISPNPFHGRTKINYELQKSDRVKIDIFNSLGVKIITLVDEFQEAGAHIAEFDIGKLKDEPMQSGIYFYRIQTGDIIEGKKMILIR